MEKLTVLAGPCLAESYQMLDEVCAFLTELSQSLNVDFYFKSSFDKANRSSGHSHRGQGLDTVMKWFSDIRTRYGVKIVSDVHESEQVAQLAPHLDMLQIPAFLCRQTDLVKAAAATGLAVNIKKGQFMAPAAMGAIVDKARTAAKASAAKTPAAPIFLTERGSFFGYSDLVVDMRSFPLMAKSQAPLLFDITHSVQRPPSGEEGQMRSKADRRFCALLARAAAATGHLAGFFLEVHPKPAEAQSDADSQLNFAQAEAMLKEIIPLARESKAYLKTDRLF